MEFLVYPRLAAVLFRWVWLPGYHVDGRDTGYRSVADGQDEETVPRCPAFKLIGQKYGPFDLASYTLPPALSDR